MTTSLDVTVGCNGVTGTFWSCCSESNKCKIGEGDCNDNNECEGSLVCGHNNCLRDYSVNGSKWDANADCCTGT